MTKNLSNNGQKEKLVLGSVSKMKLLLVKVPSFKWLGLGRGDAARLLIG